MRIARHDVESLQRLLKKMQEDQRREKIRISQRRKAQLRGKTISRITKKKSKPIVRRKPAKRSVSRR